MEIIRLSEKDIKKLGKYKLDKEIDNTESTLYVYHDGLLLKLFNSTDEEYLENKMFVINRLFYLKDYTDIKEIVWPISLVKRKALGNGYTMEFIKDNSNLGQILKDPKVPFEDKITFLYGIGKILLKVKYDTALNNAEFHFGDIHEGNFIYDKRDHTIKTVDNDSSMLSGAKAPKSKFLTYNDKLWDFEYKYPLDENSRHIPNNNTTILSYIYMLLNLITGEYSPDMSIKEFCEVLNRLNKLGVNKELLDSIFNIYMPKDNYLDFELIKTVDSKVILKYRNLYSKK